MLIRGRQRLPTGRAACKAYMFASSNRSALASRVVIRYARCLGGERAEGEHYRRRDRIRFWACEASGCDASTTRACSGTPAGRAAAARRRHRALRVMLPTDRDGTDGIDGDAASLRSLSGGDAQRRRDCRTPPLRHPWWRPRRRHRHRSAGRRLLLQMASNEPDPST